MISKNKKLLIITSLLILLPIPIGLLLWNQFPETMAVHWGITGQADGYASVPFTVFALPLLMLALHWLCILFTVRDKGNQGRNQKIFRLFLVTIPIISNLSLQGLYAFALGVKFSPVAWTVIPMGILFAAIGNYLPKTKMNSTMGIKIPWTYSSEENWNATHRFAGRIWMIGGILIMLCALLPHGWAVTVMLVLTFALCVVPMVYSWQYYKKELAEGKQLKTVREKMDKKTRILSVLFLVVLVIFLAFVLFHGDITYTFQEDCLKIDTNMYSDYVLHYDIIESVEYRDGNVPGLRVGGYGSFRLLMGFFENEEFGTYIRYTYYRPKACVVVTAGDQHIVLSGKNMEQTWNLYQHLQEKLQ